MKYLISKKYRKIIWISIIIPAIILMIAYYGNAQQQQEKPTGDKIQSVDQSTTQPEKKLTELLEREAALKKEEERLKALKKDVDERIAKYTKLLDSIEEKLKLFESAKNEKMDHIIKTFESMPGEEAAARLSAMNEVTAMKIIMKMKSKKAGVIMSFIEPKKAASLTEGILNIEKKFPSK